MSLAVIARPFGDQVAEGLAAYTEYSQHRDPGWDPFADLYGLAAPAVAD